MTLSADGRTAFIGHSYLLSFGQIATYQFGSVCVFVKGADGRWSQKAKLTADNSAEGDYVSLSADGSTALISAGWFSAYVFVRDAVGRWSKQANIPDAGGHVSLADTGRTALIGTSVFVRGADGRWSQQAKLAAADGAVKNRFGSSVSLAADGGTGLVGTWDSGAVYAYGSTAAPQPARKP